MARGSLTCCGMECLTAVEVFLETAAAAKHCSDVRGLHLAKALIELETGLEVAFALQPASKPLPVMLLRCCHLLRLHLQPVDSTAAILQLPTQRELQSPDALRKPNLAPLFVLFWLLNDCALSLTACAAALRHSVFPSSDL